MCVEARVYKSMFFGWKSSFSDHELFNCCRLRQISIAPYFVIFCAYPSVDCYYVISVSFIDTDDKITL